MKNIRYVNTEGQSISFGYIPPFYLSDLEGFGAVTNEIYSQKIYDMDGAEFVDQSLSIRDLAVTGEIVARTAQELAKYRREMESIMNPRIAGTLYYEEFDKIYAIDVKVEIGPDFDFEKSNITQKFKFVMKALDPRWRDTSFYDSLIPLSTVINKLKFPLVITNDFVFAIMESGKIVNIKNNGDYEVGGVFTIKVMSPVKNPRIYNVVTQQYFGWTGTYQLGTTLTVSTIYGKKKVRKTVDGVETNAMADHMAGSEFLTLKKGDNYLQVQSDVGINGTVGELNFTPLVVGV